MFDGHNVVCQLVAHLVVLLACCVPYLEVKEEEENLFNCQVPTTDIQLNTNIHYHQFLSIASGIFHFLLLQPLKRNVNEEDVIGRLFQVFLFHFQPNLIINCRI